MRNRMVNMIWRDEETDAYVVTHELFSRPASLTGVVLPLANEKMSWTTEELKAVVARFESGLGYELRKDGGTPKILSLSEVEKLCPLAFFL